MKRNAFAPLVLGAVLALAVFGMRIGNAWSYFTDQSYANGGLRISVEPGHDIEEDYENRKKHIRITNDAESPSAIYARVRVEANADYLEAGGISGTNWTTTPDADGWYYYLQPIEPGGQSDEFIVTIVFPVDPNIPSEDYNTPEFNIIVNYEAVPVQYDADGNPLAPQDCDWSLKLEDE